MGEETFLELLDNYLDEEEIEIKKRLDQEDPNEQKIHTTSPFGIENTITISKFANEYLEIEGDCSNLYHSGLRELGCKYLVGVDNNFANKNPELVYSNYLLLVIDAHNNRGTYINPFYIKELLKNETEDVEEEFRIFTRQRLKDLRLLKEYWHKYRELVNKIELNQKFYQVLEETHQIKKVRRMIRKEVMNNDKH